MHKVKDYSVSKVTVSYITSQDLDSIIADVNNSSLSISNYPERVTIVQTRRLSFSCYRPKDADNG